MAATHQTQQQVEQQTLVVVAVVGMDYLAQAELRALLAAQALFFSNTQYLYLP
jgi:hypothetical protein